MRDSTDRHRSDFKPVCRGREGMSGRSVLVARLTLDPAFDSGRAGSGVPYPAAALARRPWVATAGREPSWRRHSDGPIDDDETVAEERC